MSDSVNRCFRLRRRPGDGPVTEAELELVEEAVPEIGEGQALVRTLYLSLDASNRLWMNERRTYLDPVPIGGVMRGLGVGQVVASKRADLAVGDLVTGFPGWQDYAVADDAVNEFPFSTLPDPLPAPLPSMLGALGMTGISAYLGLELVGRPAPGETLVVTAAAGAVGNVAGQIGTARGARVVGIAGDDGKCRMLVDELGFDAAVNYKDPEWAALLDKATPDGIDVQFENVGGPVLNHCISRINRGGRVVLSGIMSAYGGDSAPALDLFPLIVQRGLMQAFIVFDHQDRYGEAIGYLGGLVADGRLKTAETVLEGLPVMRSALDDLYAGRNTGKLVVHVADPS
jgi:NADPH-dependent curcumin reductase CurA